VTIDVPSVVTIAGWIALAVHYHRQKHRDVKAADQFINQLESDSHD
jgi:hypothetical protein